MTGPRSRATLVRSRVVALGLMACVRFLFRRRAISERGSDQGDQPVQVHASISIS
jgi:hypothetical protein